MTSLNEHLRQEVANAHDAFREDQGDGDHPTALQALHDGFETLLEEGVSGSPLEGALAIIGTAQEVLRDLFHLEAEVDFESLLERVPSRHTFRHREELVHLLKSSCYHLLRWTWQKNGVPDHDAMGKFLLIPSTAALYVLSLAKDIPSGDPEGEMAAEICALCLKTQIAGR